MSQKTGLTPPPGPPRRQAEPTVNPDADGWKVESPNGLVVPPSPEEDLGLRPGEAYQPDPTGFVPSSTRTVDIAGRTGIPLSAKDLEELHFSHAGMKPMVNDPGSLLDRHTANMTEEEQQARAEEIARRREYENQRKRADHEKAQETRRLEDELLQGYNVNDQSSTPQPLTGPTVSAPAYFGTGPAEEPVKSTPAQQSIIDVGEASKLLEGLVAKAADARSRGDIKMATELNSMIQQILVASNLRRSQPKKERHPALQKLLNNLGLERIKPVDIEWLGSKWRFAPRPEALDWWVAENMGDNGIELNHAIIAATLIGLDAAPLYEVFNIPLSAEYTITQEATKDAPQTETKVSVPAYTKVCESCGIDVLLGDDSCSTCGAFVDRFDVPIGMRFRYASLTKSLLLEKMCLSTEQLGNLVGLMKDQIKDRRLDQDEVFPLTRLLPKPKRTNG